jgi:hypothetical protein
MDLRLFLAALVLHNMLNIPLAWCIVLVAAVTVAYTLLGGMRSVVWNDCIQLVIYLAGGVLALVVMLNRLPGGWQQVLEFASEQGKLRLFDGRWDVTESHTLWAGLVGGAFLSLGTHGTDQMMVQRYLSARHYRDAVRALLASGLVVIAQFALFLFVGIALACYFAQYPPEQGVQRMDEALAVFIIQEMPVGVAGLTLAAVFAAAMSTLSSSLNSSAAALVNDFGVWWRLDRSSAERRVSLVPLADRRLRSDPDRHCDRGRRLLGQRGERCPGHRRVHQRDSARSVRAGSADAASRPASGVDRAGVRDRRGQLCQVRHAARLALVHRDRGLGDVRRGAAGGWRNKRLRPRGAAGVEWDGVSATSCAAT